MWTAEAENDIDSIYEYYFEKSPEITTRIVNDIIDSSESLVFSEQFQIDEFSVNTRRIIVKNYKVLYRIENGNAYMLRLFDTMQNPDKM